MNDDDKLINTINIVYDNIVNISIKIPNDIQKLINDNFFEMLDDDKKEKSQD